MRYSMDNIAVANELVKVAKSLTAKNSVSTRFTSAERMIRGGGRGIELGIREIIMASEELKDLASDMRVVQGLDHPEWIIQEKLLEALNNAR